MREAVFVAFTSAQDERSDVWVRADVVTSISVETQNGVAATWLELVSGTAFYIRETPEQVLTRLSESTVAELGPPAPVD